MHTKGQSQSNIASDFKTIGLVVWTVTHNRKHHCGVTVRDTNKQPICCLIFAQLKRHIYPALH